MPAKSDAQRRLFGAVLAAKRGNLKNPSSKIQKVASGISTSDAQDFARKNRRHSLTKSMSSGY